MRAQADADAIARVWSIVWTVFTCACVCASARAPRVLRTALRPLVARGKDEHRAAASRVESSIARRFAEKREKKARGDGEEEAVGTHAQTWRRALDVRVPHRWFQHFYVVGCGVNAWALRTTAGGGFSRDSCVLWSVTPGCKSNLALMLFQCHLIRRLYESVWVSSYRAGSSMHAASYALGLAYYLGASQSWMWWGHDVELAIETPLTSRDIAIIHAFTVFGLVAFVIGNREQYRCHAWLAAARRTKTGKSSATKRSYSIPRGGWFERVSCAHYTAEIVLYLGLLAIVLPCRLAFRVAAPRVAAPTLLCVAVVANLWIAARAHHAWYIEHFGVDVYPRDRHALFFLPRMRASTPRLE